MTLPNFLVIGAPKAGTTSLDEYMREHPEIFMPDIKGARFFCGEELKDRPITTLEAYEALFDGVTDEKAIGENTALYFEFPKSAARAAAVIPNAKIIAVLREPVQRAFSIYMMNLRNMGRNEDLGFKDAVRQDPALKKMYYDGLKPYYDHFDQSQIKVILFEDLAKDTIGTMQSLYAFLGVRSDFAPNPKIANPGGMPRSQFVHSLLANANIRKFGRRFLPRSLVYLAKDVRSANLKDRKMTTDEREYGYQFFAEDLEKTEKLIGMDLSHWKLKTLQHAS